MALPRERRLRLAAEELVAQSKSRGLRIFIFGKTGVGKSSLINTLFGKKIAEEGESIYSQTREVVAYAENRSITTVHSTIDDIDITLWDSPGLKDPETNEEQTLRDIQKNCRDVDIFVYCTSLTQRRIGQDEFDSIENLTRTIGEDLWKKGLIALTFANELCPPPLSTKSAEEYLYERVSDWRTALRSAVVKSGVNKKDAEGIPVVPTGYQNYPLPGTTKDEWVFVFWSECLSRARFISLPAILHVKRAELLESQLTSTERKIQERLMAIGDQIEDRYQKKLNDAIDSVFDDIMRGDPSFATILIDVIRFSRNTSRAIYAHYGTILVFVSIAIIGLYLAVQR